MPSAPPTKSWPTVLLRPNQRFGAAATHRANHEPKFLGSEDNRILLAEIEESLPRDLRTLLSVGMGCTTLAGIIDYLDLAVLANRSATNDELTMNSIDQAELASIAFRSAK